MKKALDYVSDYQLKSAFKDATCIASSKVTQIIFAVLEDWYHHIVITRSCELVSFYIYLPIWGAKTLGQIEPKFLCLVGVYDAITPFKFGGDRFRGFWLAESQSLLFPIDFKGRPYNTHTTVW